MICAYDAKKKWLISLTRYTSQIACMVTTYHALTLRVSKSKNIL